MAETPQSSLRAREQYQLPSVEAPDLTNLEVDVLAAQPPSPEELVERLYQLLRAKAPRSEKDAGDALAEGDEVVCDIVTVVDGEIVPGGVQGARRFELREFLHLPGFIERVLGMTVYSASSFELDLPADYIIERLAGRPAIFYVEVQQAFSVETPELDDPVALAAAGLGSSTEEAMQYVAQEIDREQGELLLVEATQSVLHQMALQLEVEIPEAAIDEELRRLWLRTGASVLSGKGFSDEVVSIAETAFLNDSDYREQAGRRIKIGLALASLVEKHNLAPDSDALNSILDAVSQELGQETSELKEAIAHEPLDAQRAAHTAIYFRAVEFVMSKAKIRVLELEDLQVGQT